ncbi:hypothetical protein PCASD_06555 [Puccinia coronata f. sp. avenae]|uniref:Integrase catalytic domain-containing protein n=1 Tax=Puccinia coronata f. sp. avenae TaxID=200324 RepID=A0A2N5TFR2_9BASI|nr:hypothetical protein PCASD_06555 [Puccinia coronata f. sp. avenae]
MNKIYFCSSSASSTKLWESRTTKANAENPQAIWRALIGYYESSSVQNQSLVYQEFLALTYKTSIAVFLDELDARISALAAVGLVVGEPKKADIKESLLAKAILAKLPAEYHAVKEILYQKRPLSLQTICDCLDGKCREVAAPTTTTIVVKQESALKAKSQTAKPSGEKDYPTCSPGWQNPATTGHTMDKCRMKRKPKPKAKAAASSPVDHDDSDGSIETAASVFGASHHMFSDKNKFTKYRVQKTLIELADGNSLESTGKGYVHLIAKDDSTLKLKAFHVPGLAGTLISFGRLYKQGCDVVRTGKKTFDLVHHGSSLLLAEIVGGTCNVKLASYPQGQSIPSPVSSARKTTEIDVHLLHRAAGHPSAKALKKMFPDIRLKTLNCDACALSKSHRLPYPGTLPKATRPLEFISMDLSGKINPASFQGNQYYFKITDHFTQFRHVYLLLSKSHAFVNFVQYYNEVTNHHSSKIKTVIFDGGGEFNSKEFLNFLKEKGITVQVTAPYTPQQNLVAKRANCTTSEKARCLLKQANMPSKYWAKAVSTAVFLENVTPVRQLKWKTPYQLWHGCPFNNSRLKPFGCVAFANIPKSQRDGKFGNTSKKGLLVGYQHGAHNWRVLLPGGKVERCHDVIFHVADFPGVSIFAPSNPSSRFDPLATLEFAEIDKTSPPDTQPPNSPDSSSQDILDWRSAKDELDLDAPLIDVSSFFPPTDDEQQSIPSPTSSPPALPAQSPSPIPSFPPAMPAQISSRNPPEQQLPRPKPGYEVLLAPNKAPKDISSKVDESNILHTRRRANLAQAMVASKIPRTYREAMLSANTSCWSQAVEQELSAMEKLHVWEINLIPGNESLLGNVWVFRKKKDSEGVVVKFKARLCAQGSQQHEGFGYTYAPTGRSTSLRAALIVGLLRGYDIHQMDAKNAFLNGNLEENVYLQPPPGLDVPKGYCLKLNKAIYGLKQAPRVWYGELKQFFASTNFTPSPANPCLFVSQIAGWECFVHVYVDDMIIISHDVSCFKKLISAKFCMEDLGEAQYILGIKLTRSSNKQLLLNQETYTQSILVNYGMLDCKPNNTPMLTNTRLVAATEAEQQSFKQLNVNYREALGLLNYLSVSTRPDISFTVSQLSQHLEKLGILHWKAVQHLLRYLAGTLANGILLDGSGDISDVNVYTDANFANCTDDRRSYSGYITQLGGSLLSWRSKKQQTVSTSTTEAEYRALFEGVQKAVWLKYLFASLNIKLSRRFEVYVDNQSAIALATNPIFQQRSKHIDIIYNWLREVHDTGLIHINYISTQLMLADVCTKSLGKLKHKNIIANLKISRQ